MYEPEIKLDENGRIDVDYHIARAKEMRNAWVAEFTAELKAKVLNLLHIKPGSARLASSH